MGEVASPLPPHSAVFPYFMSFLKRLKFTIPCEIPWSKTTALYFAGFRGKISAL